MYDMKRFSILFLTAVVAAAACTGSGVTHRYYECRTPADLNAFFAAASPERPMISGHRGGNLPGYPENCLETFDRILEEMPTFYEIDPRMSKDSVIVLMHDADLERTTTGTGLVREHTYAELQELFLKDKWGAVTAFRIPKVADVVEWSRNKVILNFDIKDVTRDVLVPLVREHGGVNCIYTVRNPEEAALVHRLDSTARMSAWVKDLAQLEAYEEAGIPWENVPLAYVVAAEMQPEQAELYAALRARGVRCMVSTSPKQDRLETPEERKEAFKAVLATQPDIIETDFPTEFAHL